MSYAVTPNEGTCITPGTKFGDSPKNIPGVFWQISAVMLGYVHAVVFALAMLVSAHPLYTCSVIIDDVMSPTCN